MDETRASPKLIALENDLKAGNTTALEIFMRQVTEQGTPLVEKLENDSNHSLITFLWQGEKDTENVVVLSQLDGSFFDVASKTMKRMLDTDLWYKTYRVRNDIRTTYRFSPNDSLVHLHADTDIEKRRANWKPDPLNPHTFPPLEDRKTASPAGIASVLELPAAPPQLWVSPRPGVAKGQVEESHFRSSILKNERRIWVYTPPDYSVVGDAYGLLLVFDNEYAGLIPTATILDNLIAEHRIIPMVATIVDSIDEEMRNRELYCYPPHAEFLAQEFVPWLHKHYHVTENPEQIVVGGLSAGGLAAAFAGFQHPEVFGKILSQSGAFWHRPTDFKIKDSSQEFEWLADQFATTEKRPLSFYLEVGLLEHWYEDPPSLLFTNRHLRNVLLAKGYSIHYSEFNGGHDVICWRGTFADGLLALIGKNPSTTVA